MISKEQAKALLTKFYLDELTNEESIALTDFAKRTSFQGLLDEMKEDPKYKKLIPQIEFYRGILRDKFMFMLH